MVFLQKNKQSYNKDSFQLKLFKIFKKMFSDFESKILNLESHNASTCIWKEQRDMNRKPWFKTCTLIL